ncbi:MAG: DUF2812 domain-containing protein [Eubacteriales bacterium]
MKQFKVFIDFEKEEQYLNTMAKRGYTLKKYSNFGIYHFTEGQPQDLKYRIDYRYFHTKEDFEDYKALFEDAGWQHVYGTSDSLNQYFLPVNNCADNNIFSSEKSAASRYKHMYEMCYLNVVIAMIYFVIVLISCDFNLSNIAFLTPGLWEMQGEKFWSAFFFELPFVFLRIVPVVLFLGMGVIYAIWANKAKRMYKKS